MTLTRNTSSRGGTRRYASLRKFRQGLLELREPIVPGAFPPGHTLPAFVEIEEQLDPMTWQQLYPITPHSRHYMFRRQMMSEDETEVYDPFSRNP